MERIKKIKTTKKMYEYYCDNCGKLIGTSLEYDDGWVEPLGEFVQKVYIGSWYELKKCLCDACARKEKEKIITTIQSLGFKWGCGK